MHVPKFVEICKQDPDSLLKFQNDTATSLINDISNWDPKQDPNINYNKLHETVQYYKEMHMPIKLVHYNKYKHKKSSWITYGIIHSLHFRDKLHKTHKMTDPTSEEFEIQKLNLKTYNNILKQSIRIAKKSYYEQIFNKVKNDIKGTWKTINSILNKTKRKKMFPKIFKDNGIVYTHKKDIANKFNTYFTEIGSKLSSQIEPPINKSYKIYLNKVCNNFFKFQNVDEETIANIIDKFSPKNSSGFDGISTKLIKQSKHIFTKPLTIIINQMLNT